MKVDGVFEGGGIKVLAHLGAIDVMEEAGYEWNRLAGTSAGSILAALLAAGYNSKQLKELMLDFPFENIAQKTSLSKFPLVGPLVSLCVKNGMYKLSYIEEWMDEALRRKGILTFGNLPENKLKIVISDISNNRMSILPDDLPFYGVDPKSFPISTAVKLSCSIPYYFVPGHIKNHIIIDGAILSNYPIWIFDTKGVPRWPTIGFRLSGQNIDPEAFKIKGPVSKTISIIRTMLEAHDKKYVNKEAAARTVFIEGIAVGTIDFNIQLKGKLHLIELGKIATELFLQEWSFEEYIRTYRT
ncbi:NTE family protein [Evansella vedderi]|uniref:NTE family protein n=1 Tax=Evansella vedderi TaxID=38282 RepID=A0ABT9ZVB5_9BACI|nr:patatin-like phospholipase family protein [Evansella vedderi]MDQ0254814.1 NTE family protein [Evansella vedderi]